MSSGLDYAKAKRNSRRGQQDPELYVPSRISLRGWRTEYPEEFPVTISQIKAEENTMEDLRPIDGNGHVPGDDGKSADYRAGYNQARLDMIAAVLQHCQDNLTEVLAQVQRPAA